MRYLCMAVLVMFAAPNVAQARIIDFPHSGYCARNLLHVRYLRNCSWFDAHGHRIAEAEHLARVQKLHRYGVADRR